MSRNLESVKTLYGAMIHAGVGGKLAAFRNAERYMDQEATLQKRRPYV